ncbi:MAG TPA: AMP-binding protein [Candidatus Limnocylindrales bacterium]|nr:AMP-binding protein [Candidatus Limnocylindrales bacterium]
MDRNFAGLLVNRLGERSFLSDAATGQTVAATDLPRLIAGYAHAFHTAGLRPGDHILIVSTLSPHSGLAYLGAIYAGLVVAPVDERTMATAGESLLGATGARALWTEQASSAAKVGDASVLRLQGNLAGNNPQCFPPVPRKDSDLAALMATSGSTGVPRFVMITHGNLLANTEAIARSQGLLEDDRAMLILPLSYCFGASVFHTHLYRGGGIVFDRRFMFPDRVLHAVNQYACTTFAGVPTTYKVLLHRSKLRSIPMPSLRRFLQAGGALAPDKIREMRQAVPYARFYVMYGQTEATARISCLEPERLEDKLGSAGRPLDNLSVRLVDEHGKDVPKGEPGEIWVKGPSIARGYLNEPEESQRVFKEGWLATGDLARMDAEGYLWVQGRRSAFLKMRGVRVSFAEVEAKVTAIPGVFECAATAVPHEEAGEALVLFVVVEKASTLASEHIRHYLPAHWSILAVEFVVELPKNQNGKVSRPALKQHWSAKYAVN